MALPTNPTATRLDLPTWRVPTTEEQQSAFAISDAHRKQPDPYYSNRLACEEARPYITEVTAGDSLVGPAQYGIIHRFHLDTVKSNRSRLDDDVMANLRYILRQAGTPSDFATPLELDNGILLDEPWMQTHFTKLAVTRDCSNNWPFNDGLIFKTLHPVQCGATCVLNNQGFPIIYGVIQRILGSVMTVAGRPKVYILQWLPDPVAVEKILDAYKWPRCHSRALSRI
jgi:hypothetical protein